MKQVKERLQHQSIRSHSLAVEVDLACQVEAAPSFQVAAVHTLLYLCRSSWEVVGHLCSLLEAHTLLVEDRNHLSSIHMARLVEARLVLYLSSHMIAMSLLNLDVSTLNPE